MNQNIDLVILSSFDWSIPNVPELISETAGYAGINAIHFTKPSSILRYVKKGFISPDNIETRNLKIFSARLSKLPLLKKLQNRFVVSQIENAIPRYSLLEKKPTLIYTNMESIAGILPSIRKRFENLFYICADYSEINNAFDLNARFADKIMTIPRSMLATIEAKYPGKPFLWPQMTSSLEVKSYLSRQTIETLRGIPKPRLIYSGSAYPRTDKNLYEKISDALPEVSFISFGTENICRKVKNRYTIPWLEKRELFAFLENCDVGFMPYDVRSPHNLHCVPLKLFEYFSLGLPVVSTALLNIKEFQPHVQIASDTNGFVHIIRNLLRQNQNPQAINKRKEIAQRHSTQNMQGQLLNLLGRQDG